MKGLILALLVLAPFQAAAEACDGTYRGIVTVRYMQRQDSQNTIEFTVKDGQLSGTYRAYSLTYPVRGAVGEGCRITGGQAYSTGAPGPFPMVGTVAEGKLMRGDPYRIEYSAKKIN